MCAKQDEHAGQTPGTDANDWKRMLRRAETFSRQVDVIEACLAMGVGLREIEDYLDYLESLRSRSIGKPTSNGSNGSDAR